MIRTLDFASRLRTCRRGTTVRVLCTAGVLAAGAFAGGLSAGEKPVLHVSKEEAAKPRAGDDWPKFLGPTDFNVSRETGLLEKWPGKGPPMIWEKTVGSGYSAPSVRGNRLVLHHRVDDEEVVECMRADVGETLWEYRYESSFSDPFGYSNGPRCSPLLTKDRCFTFGAEGKLLCLELQSGEKVWMRDCFADFRLTDSRGRPLWYFGIGCTPILEGDLLIVQVGGQPNSGVVAFDAKTGKTVWRRGGKAEWDGAKTDWPVPKTFEWSPDEHVAGYSSPVAATIHGKRHILCLLRHGLISLDPKDGSVRFKYWFRARDEQSVNAARPLVIGDKVFLSAAYRQGSVLLKVKQDGKSYDVVWRDRKNMLTHWSTALHVDGFLYGFSGRHEQEGELRCLDLGTGNVEWKTNGYPGDPAKLPLLVLNRRTGFVLDQNTGKRVTPPFYGRGAKIRVGDRFIVLGEYGTLALVKVDPKKFEEVSRCSFEQISYPAWTAPVLSRKRLFLRDENSLICLDLKPTEK